MGCALVQVYVVSEGVDLPIRRLIDLAPAISPVKWQQQFGRITRPGGNAEYICTNRNLLRHGYLLDGCLPTAAVIQAQKAFVTTSKRIATRVLGLESLGRLKPTDLPLRDGSYAHMYAITAMQGHSAREYAVFVHPARANPVWATRENVKLADGTKSYGRWSVCAPPTDVAGFASIPASTLSDAQANWWKRAAAKFGLDPHAEVNRKAFQALPILRDIRGKL